MYTHMMYKVKCSTDTWNKLNGNGQGWRMYALRIVWWDPGPVVILCLSS